MKFQELQLRSFAAELHVHTVLSPCADIEMIPPLIVAEALAREIDIIAITDHNSGDNVSAVMAAARDTSLVVLPGMELQTREEVHLLCLFERLEDLLTWQQRVKDSLPQIENRVDFFGEQFIVDETGDFIRRERQLLLTSVAMGIQEAWDEVCALGGLIIPAHVDRKAFGLIANLGFVPEDIPFEALEISRNLDPAQAYRKFPAISGYPLVQGGDVHRLDDFLGANRFTLAAPTLAEMRLAMANQAGRSLTLQPFHS